MPHVRRTRFGVLPDGHPVDAVTLSNDRAVSATVITFGARLQSLLLPDRNGIRADVVPGFDGIEPYLSDPHYFGATVGRFANRIAGGRFQIDGIDHRLACNDGPNALHGGERGFDKLLWKIMRCEENAQNASVTLRLVSFDGDQGYPGLLIVTATYSLDDNNGLSILYEASSDEPTIVNITNHAYWNLAGEGADTPAIDHELMLASHQVLPTSADGIPTGERRDVGGTAFDFRQPRIIANSLREMTEPQAGFDQCWVLSGEEKGCPLVATLHDPSSGRAFDLHCNQPGLQFYTGNFLDGRAGKSGRAYEARHAVALEPQAFPDSPNHHDFPAVRLDPGAIYRNAIRYRFYTVQTDR